MSTSDDSRQAVESRRAVEADPVDTPICPPECFSSRESCIAYLAAGVADLLDRASYLLPARLNPENQKNFWKLGEIAVVVESSGADPVPCPVPP